MATYIFNGKTMTAKNTENKPEGIAAHFKNHDGGKSMCAVLETKVKKNNGDFFCADGKGVRRLGGSAPSAFLSSRGAAGAINAALLSSAAGMTLAELASVCAENGAVRPVDKAIAHIKGFFQQADVSGYRLRTTGVIDAINANGWNVIGWRNIPAVTIDGKVWDGAKLKQCATTGLIQSPLLWCCAYKYSKSLAKALGLE